MFKLFLKISSLIADEWRNMPSDWFFDYSNGTARLVANSAVAPHKDAMANPAVLYGLLLFRNDAAPNRAYIAYPLGDSETPATRKATLNEIAGPESFPNIISISRHGAVAAPTVGLGGGKKL